MEGQGVVRARWTRQHPLQRCLAHAAVSALEQVSLSTLSFVMGDPSSSAEPESEFDALALALGHVVLSWNWAERAIVDLLLAIARDSAHSINIRADILIAEMGSRQVSEALRSMAYDVLDGEPADRVRHAAGFHDRLLAYRNYYVHGIFAFFPADDAVPQISGFIDARSAKGKLVWHNDSITLDQLTAFKNQALQLANFASQILFSLYFPAEPPTSLPDKPALPAPLAKPRREWREMTRPHQS